MPIRIFVLTGIAAICLSSCYWGTQLDEQTNILIIDNFTIQTNNCTSHIYINNNTPEEYKAKIIDALRNDLQYYNVNIVNEKHSKIDYTLRINKAEFKETSHSEVVNDESSPYHGKTYELIDCDADVDFELYKGNQAKLVNNYYVLANKEEKLTNNRNLGDYILGTNRDNSEYREKLLPDDIFMRLAEKCGKRISGKATKKIAKNRK